MNITKNLIAAAAVVLTASLIGAPANASVAEPPQVHFSGHCTNNTVTYGIPETTQGDTVPLPPVEVDVRAHRLTVEILRPGTLGGTRIHFKRNGIAKTVNVWTDGTTRHLIASHTYWCGSRA